MGPAARLAGRLQLHSEHRRQRTRNVAGRYVRSGDRSTANSAMPNHSGSTQFACSCTTSFGYRTRRAFSIASTSFSISLSGIISEQCLCCSIAVGVQSFKLGKQPAPVPFTHNSGWVQTPGREVLAKFEMYPHLKEYVQGVLGRFGKDRRVVVWDVWNEPDNYRWRPTCRSQGGRKTQGAASRQAHGQGVPLGSHGEAFAAAHFGACGRAHGGPTSNSATSSNYKLTVATSSASIPIRTPEELDRMIGELGHLGRPLICTEYMARPQGSTFDPNLGLLRSQRRRRPIAGDWWRARPKRCIRGTLGRPSTRRSRRCGSTISFRTTASPTTRRKIEYIRRITRGK